MKKSLLWRFFFVFITFTGILTLQADFYCKVPEFNPGDGAGGYDLFKPPWYPFDINEAKEYTVNEVGQLIKREEGEQGLLDYGKKKNKAEEVQTQFKKTVDTLVFEKVLGSPRVFVADFYAHCMALGQDVLDLMKGPGWRKGAGSTRHNLHNIVRREDALDSGYPPIPGHNRLLYDSWAVAVQTGWDYEKFGTIDKRGPEYPIDWKGYLIPNLREFSLWYVTEGVATSKQCIALLERNVHRDRFSPELTALKALSGEDYGWNPGQWTKNYITPLYGEKKKPWPEDFHDWDKAVHSLIMTDLTRKRAPAVNAFHHLRDVPELSEPIFLKLIDHDQADQLMKRNLAMLLESFTSPRSARALHQLARDEDPVTAVRAVNSLSRHPHGQVKQILFDWLNPEEDDIRRTKAILMLGRTGRSDMGDKLFEFYENCADDFERELVLRSLMRLRYHPAKPLFKQAKKSKFKPLAYIGELGLLTLNELTEGQIIDVINRSFYRADAIPTSGTIVSFSQHLRLDLIKWMAHTEMKVPRRHLWKYIREFQDLGSGSEEAGVPHILAYGLFELELGDEIIPTQEAVKLLNIMATRTETDTLIRIAALSRLYELDPSKALAIAHKVIKRFLKGRKVKILGSSIDEHATELDVLEASVNLILLDNPDHETFFESILLNPNIGGDIKSRLLENMYRFKRKTALRVIKKSLLLYAKKDEPTQEEKRYLIRLIRFAGMFKEKKILKDVLFWMDKSSDPWVRFVCLYACRLALESGSYGNVISGTAQDRRKLFDTLNKELKKFK